MIIREIDAAIGAVMNWRQNGQTNWLRPQENTPMKILSVDVNGNFSTFSPELLGTVDKQYGSFSFGNVFDTSIAECLQQSHYRSIAAAISDGIDACRNECDYFELCGGGSPSNKLAETARLDSTETAYCRLQKQACLDLALDLLENQLGIE
jgi:uncharacterized protein